MPSGVWLFSRMAARILGKASALPLCVYQLILSAFCLFEATLHPVGLKAFEVGDRAHFQPLFCAAADLEIKGAGRGNPVSPAQRYRMR